MIDLNKERSEFEAWFQATKVYGMIRHQIDMRASGEHQTIFNVFQRDDFRPENYAHIAVVGAWLAWQEKAKAQAVPEWISAEVGRPIKFGTRVKIKRKAWDEDDNLIIVESEATYDKDSDFCELSNRSYEYETWFDHELKKYLDEDELTHWAPLDKSESGAEDEP